MYEKGPHTLSYRDGYIDHGKIKKLFFMQDNCLGRRKVLLRGQKKL